ncbi:molybdenum cofactor sulfurase-like [Cornus florida]|uniref:molybdenum cofactor sulfurase-like n=1 Tax=Cornus florida TaxID=4283 RepID=UPI0028A1F656|nr:molybdenum cofactor sulfurase-like [Cornus florida]
MSRGRKIGGKIESPSIRETSKDCFHGCYPTPFLSLPDPTHHSKSKQRSSATASGCNFTAATASSLPPNTKFTNHESLPLLEESFSNFNKAYPQYPQTQEADQIRAQEYYHLSFSSHVCLDYVGHSLFSYSEQQNHYSTASNIASSSSSHVPFFNILYKSVNLNSQILYGGQGSEFESKMQKRIMRFMNISEDDYSMVFTANQSSAFRLLADTFPFQSNQNLLTVYDYENEAVEVMIRSSEKRGAQVASAEFSWPSLRIQSRKLRKLIESKRNKSNRGLFVFPLQSRITGARYSYLWMSLARENGWHVLLDACALGAKDTQALGLSMFRPDFIVCSFFKVFGETPSGFCCLFVKKSSAKVFDDSTVAPGIGIVSLVPAKRTSQSPEELGQTSKFNIQKDETKEVLVTHKEQSFSEIVELENTLNSAQSRSETSTDGSSEIGCRGLDHADSLGLTLISRRARYQVNWLVNALMSLRHPNSNNGPCLVRIYGPKIMFDRGPAVAFNVFDWKGEKIDPTLVQKLADRNNISLSYGFLHHIWFPDKYEDERERILERKSSAEEEGSVGSKRRENFHLGISVVTASLGFLTNFEDTYRLWAFVSCFLDADFVEKERWRYKTLNQITCEV